MTFFINLFSGLGGMFMAGGAIFGWFFLICILLGYVPYDDTKKGGKRG